MCQDSNKMHEFTVERIIELIKFLTDNVYIMNGNKIRRQATGIPMGTNNAPPVANLYLYGYESKYIDQLVSSNKTELAMSFNKTNIFRH